MVRSRGAGGVLVTEVDDNSPAARAGVQIADVILSVDDVQVDVSSEYLSLLRSYPPGSGVILDLLRGEQERRIALQLEALPEGYAFNYFARIFGLNVSQDGQGVVVSNVLPDSPAARIELRPGDRIVEIEGEGVTSLENLVSQIEANLGRLPLRLTIYRGNQGYLVTLP